ncbi:hypothetical protein BU17DRAFT_46823 [Hysterangium stoloniferum]|nr:hypothetical protein BU17DRAFT_46823 [Hysterangium stoloniferum]
MATSFQVVLDDTSPVVNYFPFAETLGVANLLVGWNSYFSASGFLSKLGELGQGTSMHVTGLDGAALTIQWKGTGISLFGSTFRSTYDVSIDGQPAVLGTAQNGLLANFQELGDREHVLELVAHPAISIDDSSYVAFDHALLNVTTPLTGYVVSF